MNTIFIAIFCVGLLPNPSVIEDVVPVLEVAYLIHEDEGLEAGGIEYIFRDRNGVIIDSKYVPIEDGWNEFWRPYGTPIWDRNVVVWMVHDNDGNGNSFIGLRKVRADVTVETVHWERFNPASWESRNMLPAQFRKGLSTYKPVVKDWKYWKKFISYYRYDSDFFSW